MCSACPFGAKMDKPIVTGKYTISNLQEWGDSHSFLVKRVAMHHQTTNTKKLDGEDGKVRQIKLSGSFINSNDKPSKFYLASALKPWQKSHL